jgi:ABC-2 type transport system permease protein
MLLYFRSAQGIGDLLAGKLLGMALLTFLMVLLLSNVITALSTFFLSRDLELIVSSPSDPLHVYWARLAESGVNSSWMVLLMTVPLLAAYGVMYSAGAGFYLLAAGTIVPLLVIPAVVGAAVTLCLVNVFPARRTRDLLALVAIFAAAGVVVLIRLVRPERLIRPEEAGSLVDFMATLRTPTSPWLPSEWAAGAMLSWLNGRFDPFLFILLLTSSAAFLVLGGWLHTRFYHSGFSRAQEGAERQEGRVRRWKWEKVLSGLSLTTRELTKKEIRVFLRDSTQWSQLILLGVLVVVYVYNIQALRVAGDTELSFLLVNLIGFLNLGLAGFVVAAIAARFVFPAMSLEGRMTWLLRSSPLDPRKLFWVKYWVGTIPLLAVALPLILVTNFLLGVAPLLMVVSSLTMVAVTLAFSAMALAFGALYPNYETENPAEIPTSFGGLLFMMSAVAYLAGIIVLEGWPVYHFLRARFEVATFRSDGIIPLLLGLSGALVLTGVILVLSLRTGVARIREAEIYAGEGD